MNRELIPNPDSPEYSLMKLALDREDAPWRKCLPNTVPAGFRVFARWDGNWLTLGIEKIPQAAGAAPKPKATRDYTTMTDAELKTECGLKSLKYTKDSTRTDLLGMLGA